MWQVGIGFTKKGEYGEYGEYGSEFFEVERCHSGEIGKALIWQVGIGLALRSWCSFLLKVTYCQTFIFPYNFDLWEW